MARPKTHTPPEYGLFQQFDVDTLVRVSNGYYRASYLLDIEAGRQPATRRFRLYWVGKLGSTEESLFGGTHDK